VKSQSTTTKPTLRRDSRELATIQQVLRETRVQVDDSVESGRVVVTDDTGGTKKEGRGEMGLMGERILLFAAGGL
jgi:hypothetical protein